MQEDNMDNVEKQAVQTTDEAKELTINDLTENEKTQVTQIASQIDIEDTQNIIEFGYDAQNEISTFSDTILENIRAKDSGYVGEVLTDLMLKVKSMKVDKLPSGESFLEKIPILNNFVSGVKKFIARYEKLNVQIDTISDELEKARMTLLKDITLFDTLYEKNNNYLKALDLYILAGKTKLKELGEKILPEMKARADASSDPMDAQKVKDLTMMINRLEKKIYDLKLSRMISLQTAPQVRLIQGNDQTLVEKIQSSILNTIPLWKNQVVISIGLFRQKQALELQKEVSSTTNELLQKNAEMLKEGTIDVARESEKGIVEIETLKKVNDDLITTIEETLRIQKEGKSKRQTAEVELRKIESDLKKKLVQIKAEEVQ
jgi:uncharacterized protein YaaN involved in tellurite resistance